MVLRWERQSTISSGSLHKINNKQAVNRFMVVARPSKFNIRHNAVCKRTMFMCGRLRVGVRLLHCLPFSCLPLILALFSWFIYIIAVTVRWITHCASPRPAHFRFGAFVNACVKTRWLLSNTWMKRFVLLSPQYLYFSYSNTYLPRL